MQLWSKSFTYASKHLGNLLELEEEVLERERERGRGREREREKEGEDRQTGETEA